MEQTSYQATPRRFLLALAVALIVGPAFLVLGIKILMIISYSADPHAYSFNWPVVRPEFLAWSAIFSTIGLLFLGAPGWLLLHLSGHNGPVSAFIWGYVAWLVGYCILIAQLDTPVEQLLLYGAALAISAGGLTGVTMWRITYRRSVSGTEKIEDKLTLYIRNRL